MHLDVLLFASAADAFGAPRLALDVPDDATAAEVRAAVVLAAHECGAELPASTRLAVNHAFADGSDPVRPGDEVAVIPPVAGG